MALGKLPVPGRLTIWMVVGQGPIALAVGAGGGCLDIFGRQTKNNQPTNIFHMVLLKGSNGTQRTF